MMSLVLLFVFVVAVSSQGGNNPNDYVCNPRSISPARWAVRFPTNTAFNGFFRADGAIRILDPLGNTLFSANLDGSVWHQYFDSNGNLVGDLFLAGLAPPGILVLASRQTSNPMLSNERVCQIFVAPSPPNLVASYSELLPLGEGYMTSYYVSKDPATAGQVFSNEFFSFDSNFTSAFSETNTFTQGPGVLGHYVAQSVNFRYVPITQAQATALGWNGNVANFVSVRGIHGGRGAVPIEVFTVEQRAQLKKRGLEL